MANKLYANMGPRHSHAIDRVKLRIKGAHEKIDRKLNNSRDHAKQHIEKLTKLARCKLATTELERRFSRPFSKLDTKANEVFKQYGIEGELVDDAIGRAYQRPSIHDSEYVTTLRSFGIALLRWVEKWK